MNNGKIKQTCRQIIRYMDEEKLYKLYEKLYFDEIERREKLDSRLQLPFSLFIVISGILAFMLLNMSSQVSGFAVVLFWIFFVATIIAMIVTLFFFRKAWLGYKYMMIPTPKETEKYRKELEEYYKDHNNTEQLVSDAMHQYHFEAYINYSSWNMENNDMKMLNLTKTATSLFISFLLCILTFLPFYFGNLDKSKDKNMLKVPMDKIQKVIVQESTKDNKHE